MGIMEYRNGGILELWNVLWSFRPKPESSIFKKFRTPAFAGETGDTILGCRQYAILPSFGLIGAARYFGI